MWLFTLSKAKKQCKNNLQDRFWSYGLIYATLPFTCSVRKAFSAVNCIVEAFIMVHLLYGSTEHVAHVWTQSGNLLSVSGISFDR